MTNSGRKIRHATSLRFSLKQFTFAFFLLTSFGYSQENVGIGTATPDSSAVLELSTQLLSSPKGFLVPRITTAQRNSIALPANGLLIYNTTTNQFEYNSGSAISPTWLSLLNSTYSGGGGSGWGLTGNSGTSPASNFIGTIDAQDLVLKTTNIERLRISSGGNFLLKSGATASEFQLFEPSGSGSNYTAFKAQAQSGNVIYTLPSAYGSASQVLSTDAGGNLSWILPGNTSVPSFSNSVDSNALTQYGVLIGGYNNSQSAQSGFVGAGQSNDMQNGATYGAIVGGYDNTVGSQKGFVGSGQGNALSSGATSSAIVAGEQNTINGVQNFVGAGQSNTINSTATNSIIGAGASNTLGGTYNFIGGGQQNTMDNTADWAAIASGYLNRISGDYSAIPGGQNLRLGSLSFGFNAGGSTDLSSQSQVAYFGDVDVWIGGVYSTARQLRFYEPNSSSTYTGTNYTAFRAGTQTADLVYTLPTSQGGSGSFLTNDGSGNLSWSTGSVGTVTSVGLSMPSMFTVTNSPVTTSGTLTATLAPQWQGTVLAAPVSGGMGTPSFRALTAGDIASGTLTVAQGGTGATWLSGIIVGNGASPFTSRTLYGTSNQITLTNGSGTGGDPTIALATNTVLPGNASSSGTFTAGTGLTVSSGNITFTPFSTGILRSSAAGVISSSPITLSSGDITGTLPVANGGTGVTTITGLLSGNGTSGFVGRTITGTSNQITVANGNGATANPTLSITTNPVLPGNASSSGTFTAGTGLTVTTGGATVSAGGINVTGGLTVATGTTTLSPLSTGIVHSSSTGVLSSSPVVLTSEVSGVLPVANGGTGVSTITGILAGNGTTAVAGRTITGTNNQITVTNGNGATANPTIAITTNPTLPGTGSVTLPSGSTATRPASPVNGMMRYNTTTGKFEFYQGDTWVNPLGASLSGGGTVNFVPKYNESTTLGNSNIFDNGTTVSIGNTSPSGTALLEVTSTTKGFLMPRMTESQRDAISSPATGLMVYCTDGAQPGINYFDGVEWTRMIVENAPGSVHVVNKPYDQAGNGSMENDSALKAPIGPYETWVIDGVIHIEAPNNSSISIAFTHPTGASMKVGYHANTSTANLQTGIITTSGAATSISIKAGEPLVVLVKAVVITQANGGNFQFTWNANSNVLVKASSFFITSQGQ